MTLVLLCQFTAQHVSDVNTSIFRCLRLFGALLCRLYCADLRRVGVMWRDWLLVMWHPSAGWTTTESRLNSAQYSVHNNAPSSRKLLKMDVLTSETCWAVNWHNKTSVIKLVYLYSNIFFLYLFIPILYMFRATKYSSPGESIVSIRTLVCVTVCTRPCGVQV